jgi:hypothetical protein
MAKLSGQTIAYTAVGLAVAGGILAMIFGNKSNKGTGTGPDSYNAVNGQTTGYGQSTPGYGQSTGYGQTSQGNGQYSQGGSRRKRKNKKNKKSKKRC